MAFSTGDFGMFHDFGMVPMVPLEAEILDVEEFVRKIKEQVEREQKIVRRQQKDFVFWRETYYVALERNGSEGRAFAGSPLQLTLLLHEYSLAEQILTNKKLADEVTTVGLFLSAADFLYDFSREETEGFCMIRRITITEFLLNQPDIPETLCEKLFLLCREAMKGIYLTDVLAKEIFDDGIDSRVKKYFKTELSLEYDDIFSEEREKERFERTFFCFERIMKYETAVPAEIFRGNFMSSNASVENYFQVHPKQFAYLIPKLPLLFSVFDDTLRKDNTRTWSSDWDWGGMIELLITTMNNKDDIFAEELVKQKRILLTKKSFQILKQLFVKFSLKQVMEHDSYDEKYREAMLMFTLLFSYLYHLRMCEGKKYRDLEEEVIQFMKERMADEEIRKEVLSYMFKEYIEHHVSRFFNSSTHHFFTTVEMEDFVKLYKMLFGKKVCLPMGENLMHIDLFQEEEREQFERMLSLVDSCEESIEWKQGRKKYQFYTMLLALDDEELLRECLQKGCLPLAYIKRTLKSIVARGICRKALPYLIYLCQSGSVDSHSDEREVKI